MWILRREVGSNGDISIDVFLGDVEGILFFVCVKLCLWDRYCFIKGG